MAGLDGVKRDVRFSSRYSKSKFIIALILLSVLLAVVVRIIIAINSNNFDVVIPEVIYRSAQPSASDVGYIVKRYGIKSIINLRDEERGGWYREEAAAAKDNNIQLIDLPINSARPLSKEERDRLISVLKNSPKPVLVHCEHGSNRTGLAAAVFVKLTGYGDWYAEFQLSPYYGHIPVRGLGRYAMQESWRSFKQLWNG